MGSSVSDPSRPTWRSRPWAASAALATSAWRESLARSKTQIAAGESVPLLPVLDRLRVSAERLEAEQGVTADGERIATAGGGR